MKKLKTFAFCTLLAALAANHTPATAANGPTGDAAPATRDSEPKMYAWEQERDAIPSYTDLVLCYGGSHHRTPYRWDKERFTPFVTYVDESGREHWLFDGFLCLEFQDSSRPDGGKYAYMVGVLRGQGVSAGKQQWKELIDYWFDGDNGVNALEAAVKEASQRLGTPPAKRKVVMVMPDPIIYRKYDDTNESTTYWGSLGGRQMDFAKGADRVAACKWYIDQVRRRFDEGNYQYVELAGFYPISEEIVTPGDGYCHELKKSEEVIPQVAEYLHAINQSFCWIPYNRAAGYTKWKEMGIDYAYMQPNHYWDDKGVRPLSRYFSDIKAYDLAMEFEFDENILEGEQNSEVYKKRFREYMEGAKKHGVYGRKPLSYYHGTNRFYDLWASTAAKDKELFHEFCRFVIDNPLRQRTAASGKPAAEQGYRTTEIQDLALIYQGGSHRLDWTVDEFRPYVVHRFADGSKDWLFDGFLFLEFKDGSGRNYTVGYEKLNARRTEWEWLLDRIFEQGKSLSALDRCIGEEIGELGKPAFRHRIVLGLPEAIRGQKDWGEIDGREMDFSKEEDQIAATKWYIGELVERFKAAKYKHLELSGFYWVAEDTHHCEELTIPLSEYIHSEGKLFYWIPYWQAKGHEEWKRLGFDVAYQQPNHFFNHSIPDSRLDEACATARRHGMAMEFEFDEKATAAIPNSSHDRMAAYINHFEKNDVFNSSAVAYYCGNRGVLTLDESDNPKDKALMDRLARIIQARRYLKYGIPMKNKTRVVAHRGFWHTDGSAQNSIASLLKADQLGVYGVEFDVWMASDGVPVLNHDGWHDGYEVQSTPSTVLTTLKLENGEPMPTLAQYLEAAKDTKVHLVLELKPHATPEAETAAAEAVVKMVGRYGLSKRVTYISFSLHIMKELARLAPAKTQLLYLGGGTLPKDLKAMGLTGCDFNYGVYLNNPTWLNDIKALKMASNVWTVNNPADMMWAIENRVDYITTDRPDLFLKLTRK